jgi:hypothetical protein
VNGFLRLGHAIAAGAAVLCCAGCGLKGPLAMPERSSNVVIRGPSGEVVGGPAAPEAGGTPAGETTPPTGDTAPATKKPAYDRMPPPPLPGGNRGSTQGG